MSTINGMDATERPRRTPAWLWVITILLAAGLLYLALRKVDWNEMVATLRRGDLLRLAIAVCILSVSCVARGLRWRVLLSAEKTLPPPMVFWATMIGYLGNSFLPARAGEVLRAVVIGRAGGISKSFSLATALTERIVDAVILVVVTAVALTTLAELPLELAGALRGMAVIGLIGAVVVLVAPRMGGLAQRVISRLPVSEKLRETLRKMSNSFLTGAGALQHWGRLGQFLLFSSAIWALDTLTALTTASAFGLSITPVQVFILLAALGIASALPSTPGYVGVYQFVAVTVLVPFGLSESQAVAYIIAYQGVNYVVILLWGLTGLWKLKSAVRV